MSKFMDLITFTEEEVLAALTAPGAWEALDGFCERDMRSFWLVEHQKNLVLAARKARVWYRGESGEPVPKTFLSDLIHPGQDCDKGLVHRLMAFARSAVNGTSLSTLLYLVFKGSSFIALRELEATCPVAPIKEAWRQLEAFFAYLENAARNHHSQEQYTQVLLDKSREYGRVCLEISKAYEARERALLGQRGETPFEQQTAAALDEIGRSVDRIGRKVKAPSTNATAQMWALRMWSYYRQHPEGLCGDVARRRVYLRDVWAVVGEEARKRGLADFNAFRAACRAGKKNAQRRGAAVDEGENPPPNLGTRHAVVQTRPTAIAATRATSEKESVATEEERTVGEKNLTSARKAPSPEADSPSVRSDSPTARGDSPTAEDDSPSVRDDSPTAEDDSPTGGILGAFEALMAQFRKDFRDNARKVLAELTANVKAVISAIAEHLGFSEISVWRSIRAMKSVGLLAREGSNRCGNWILVR